MTGLKDAQDLLKDSHARVCPKLSEAITTGGHQAIIGLSTEGRPIALVEYDVAVEVASDGAGGELRISSVVVSTIVKGKKDSEKNSARLKFSVPVSYPEIAL